MANEDKNLFIEIGKVFDSSALQIKAIAEEIPALEIKFGTQSIVVKKKREQLDAFRLLYDKTLYYINFLRDLNHNMATEFTSHELLRYQRETGLPISKIMQLAGHDPEKWKEVDKWDERINKIKKVLNIPEELNAEFEEFVKALRA